MLVSMKESDLNLEASLGLCGSNPWMEGDLFLKVVDVLIDLEEVILLTGLRLYILNNFYIIEQTKNQSELDGK